MRRYLGQVVLIVLFLAGVSRRCVFPLLIGWRTDVDGTVVKALMVGGSSPSLSLWISSLSGLVALAG